MSRIDDLLRGSSRIKNYTRISRFLWCIGLRCRRNFWTRKKRKNAPCVYALQTLKGPELRYSIYNKEQFHAFFDFALIAINFFGFQWELTQILRYALLFSHTSGKAPIFSKRRFTLRILDCPYQGQKRVQDSVHHSFLTLLMTCHEFQPTQCWSSI